MAASLARRKARRGSARWEGRPLQEQSRSQVPWRRCSGESNQIPI
jgi:hypothetical protein